MQKNVECDPQNQTPEMQYYQQMPVDIHQSEHDHLQNPFMSHTQMMSDHQDMGLVEEHYGQMYYSCNSVVTS
jgi:hypothetical protein